MLRVINWKKINGNKFMGKKQCNSHLPFPGQHYSFQRFFQTFPYPWSFSRVFKALKISTLNSRTFHAFPGSVRALAIVTSFYWCPIWAVMGSFSSSSRLCTDKLTKCKTRQTQVQTVLYTCIKIYKTGCQFISQLPNKFHGHFATPLEYVISLIRYLLGVFVY